MGDFIYQIQRVSDNAKGTIVRLGMAETVAWEDNEKTLSDVQERLKKTIDFLEAIVPKTVEGEDDVEVVLKTRSKFHPHYSCNIITDLLISRSRYQVHRKGLRA